MPASPKRKRAASTSRRPRRKLVRVSGPVTAAAAPPTPQLRIILNAVEAVQILDDASKVQKSRAKQMEARLKSAVESRLRPRRSCC